MQAPKPALTTSTQPQAIQMNPMSPPARNHTQCENQGKAHRLRGGGAGKDCLLGAVECFLCFECCKDCCECFADIVCCPCEMCC
ncbi:hypothetical protein PHLGIDRAFT_19511 [Phlebiopsis gigantea 11061_1 CR5-6]|uniref:Uncharacterized protein n=1 Tax=Phlebiopsis gigantea (strain 11061_1 CR5-6) TaxID=745531 RepID=A0A0C3S9H6_PHLG1|nr:hypothetical protein PHLGIDRAFT_19511 [Phlebiopsis gigantea 11061_1 CR5-6]